MSTEYKILTIEEAHGLGLEWPGMDWADEWGCQVWRFVNGVPVELIGEDGGEPEDQTLGRDWAWVVSALNRAYERGRGEFAIELLSLADTAREAAINKRAR